MTHDASQPPPPTPPPRPSPLARGGITRRFFIKGAGMSVAAAGLAGPALLAAESEAAGDVPLLGPGRARHEFIINGAKRSADVEPSLTLVDLLRDRLDRTGTKRVCDRASCGACTVLIDGTPVYSCTTLAVDAAGREITTIEGIAKDGKLSVLQQAFVECDALQCGFCTPGFVMACSAVLTKNPKPSRAEVAHGIAGNICRCGTYENIFEAMALAAERSATGGGARGK